MNNNISKDVTITIWYLKHDHSWRTYVSRFRWRGVEVRQVFLVSTQLVQVLYGINTHCFRYWFGQLKWEYTQIAPQHETQFTSNKTVTSRWSSPGDCGELQRGQSCSTNFAHFRTARQTSRLSAYSASYTSDWSAHSRLI